MAADAHDRLVPDAASPKYIPDPDPYPLRYVALTPGVMERLSPIVLEQLARIEAKLDRLLASKLFIRPDILQT